MLRDLVNLLLVEKTAIFLRLILTLIPPAYFLLHPQRFEIGSLLAVLALTSLIYNFVLIGVLVAIQDSKLEKIRRIIILCIGLFSVVVVFFIEFFSIWN